MRDMTSTMSKRKRPLCTRSKARTIGGAVVLSLALAGIGAAAVAATAPQYGGTLQVTTVFPTLSALSWDLQEWHWKQNHDTGMYFEQLFVGDLDKSVRKGGKYRFVSDAWLPSDAIRGEFAESWKWENPLTMVIRLRKGVMLPDRSGVMKARERTADEVG